MLQIEQDLKNDQDGAYKNELLLSLNQKAAEVRVALGQGLQPEEYKKLDKLLKALEVGAEVVQKA